jgi:hypothetical protein
MSAAHADMVPAEGFFDIIECIADLCSQRFTSHAMNDVLVLTFRQFCASTQRLPQPDRWNVSYHFISHEFFDSVGRILVHDQFRNRN